jgi:signal transduction histidine kinase
MITPAEAIAVVAVLLLTAGGLFVSIQDAVQLAQTLNLDLRQTVIVTQGIVNLQREVQLTHNEVTRLLGGLDNPPKPITRFDFVEVQVNNLANEAEQPNIKYAFSNEDLQIVEDIELERDNAKELITRWEQGGTAEEQTARLKALDNQMTMMEATIKLLIDRQSTAQREAIIQTRDSLQSSQHTSLIAISVLLLTTIVLVVVVRRALGSRLERAIEADQIKSQLLASVSHELRTPLAAISGYSQLLSENAYGALNEKQHNTMQRILINTAQLQGMVNNLLDRAQIEQGKITLRNAAFAPADLIETASSALNILARSKNLELTSEITSDVPSTLTGDKLRLQQILFNLISNALKFTESGSVRIKIFLPDSNHWALQVSDTGIGIPAEAQTNIFESFWQADSSATRQYRGSGLGLSIVKELTDLMGGTIALESQPLKGSTFTITFPMEPKQ